MTPEDSPATSATVWGLASLIVVQAFKTVREWLRDDKQHRETAELLRDIRHYVRETASHEASRNRKQWRRDHPGIDTPMPDFEPRTYTGPRPEEPPDIYGTPIHKRTFK